MDGITKIGILVAIGFILYSITQTKSFKSISKQTDIETLESSIKHEHKMIDWAKNEKEMLKDEIPNFSTKAFDDLQSTRNNAKKELIKFAYTMPILLIIFMHLKLGFILIAKAYIELFNSVLDSDYADSFSNLFTEQYGSINGFYLSFSSFEIFMQITLMVSGIWTVTILYRKLCSLNSLTVEKHNANVVKELTQRLKEIDFSIIERKNRIKSLRKEVKTAKSDLRLLEKT
jgi:hypothetical protein